MAGIDIQNATNIEGVQFQEQASPPATPLSGYGKVYALDDGSLYYLNDAGIKSALTLPPGVVMPFAGSTQPPGFLMCQGQSVSRTTYAHLFAVIGTTFGAGDGSTTFNLPDLRDRFPLGDNDMGGSDAGRVGNYNTDLADSGGEDQHTLTTSEMPSHRHKIVANNNGGVTNGVNAAVGITGGTDVYSDYQGGGATHNNMPPFLVLNYIIKT